MYFYLRKEKGFKTHGCIMFVWSVENKPNIDLNGPKEIQKTESVS